MKTLILVPDPLLRAGDRLAKHLGLSRSQVFQRALGAYLEAHEDARTLGALDAVYEKRCNNPGLDPAVERMQAISLVREKW